MTMEPVRILIVGDDPLARAGLAALLGDQSGCAVVGQSAREADLSAALSAYRPEVVVWDLGWDPTQEPAPVREADLERLAGLGEAAVPVLALLRDESHAADAWTAGVRGLLLREADGETIAAALQAVIHGLAVLHPAMAGPLLASGIQAHAPDQPLIEELTPRELMVLELLAEGLPNKSIAARLGISEHTVKFHVNSILGKLGAQSRTDAVMRATRLGLILL
jgi:DNA-binding NarL/FixJ family response regulator